VGSMTSSGSRASGTSLEQLRETIVRAAMPLVAEWDAVTTARLAHAAGIDEATLLHAFDDKDAVFLAAMRAYLMTVFDPTAVFQDLRSVPLDQPLDARLVGATDALDTYYDRMVTALAPLHASGTPQRGPAPDSGTAGESRTRPLNREDLRSVVRMDVISEAVTALMEPDEERLRLPAGTLADAFLGLYSGHRRTPHREPSRLPAAQLVDLFLHGALTPR